MSREDANIFIVKSACCASSIYAERYLFMAPAYSLSDTGRSSFVRHLRQQWGIERTLHFYQLTVLYARADTSTDADVLPQPSPTTVVVVHKMRLACYNYLPTSPRLASHLFVCGRVSGPGARPSPTTQPPATVQLRLFPQLLT
jgi:hypothetical protein